MPVHFISYIYINQYCLSTASSQPIEAVAAANDAGASTPTDSNRVHAYDGPNGGAAKGPRFFQLYMGHDDEIVSCAYLPVSCARIFLHASGADCNLFGWGE